MARTKKNPNQIKTKQAKKARTKKIIMGCFLVVVLLVASTGVYLGFKIYQQTEGFDANKLTVDEASVQIAGKDEYYQYGSSGTSKNVSYDDLPQVLIDAVVAAEDSRFFEHNGFDLPRIVKAFMGNLVAGHITGGGSTITQQLIKKSYYPDEQKTIERKVGEVILSVQASKKLTKQQVLELYLNRIYFGNGPKTIGVYAASKYYFDKAVQNLTLPEAALLAGTLNSPSSFDPFYHLDRAQKRRDVILGLMCDHGYITEEERDKARAIPVQNTLKYNPIKTGGKYQAYADMVTREVIEKTGMDPTEVGMKIYTYMDKNVQSTLDDIASGKSYSFCDKYIQAGACVQETQHGRVVGVLSGRDYQPLGTTHAYAADKEKIAKKEVSNYGQRNQPGSSLKPIISYASAFEYLNYSTAHYVHDIPYSSGKWTPKNWNGKFQGDVSIKEALYQSWNLAAINTLNEVLDEVGEKKMTKYMEGFGYDMYDEDFSSVYAIGGWATGVSPEESAGAYATISNGGTYYEPHTVEKIEIIATGEVIYIDKDVEKEKKRAISEEAAFMIRDVMTSYVKDGSGQYGRYNLGYQIGAKSGTSNHPTSGNIPNKKLYGKSKDSWMVGFSPDYSWAVWCGYDYKDQKKGRYVSNSTDSKKIAAIIAKAVHKGGLKNSYNKPSGVVQAKLITGIYPYVSPGSGVPSDRIATGWFKKGYTPKSSANGAKLNDLKSFTATLSNNKINVEFTAYDPVSRTKSSTPTKKYGSYTLPYLGDINQIYGKVVYKVEVKDSSGKVVHTQTLNTNKATLSYTPKGGNYTVTGYYALEKGSTTSNKINVTLNVKATLGGSFTITSTNTTSIGVRVVVPTGNTVKVDILDVSGNVLTSHMATSNQSFTFDNLTPGTTYTIKATETTTDGQSKDLGSKQITTTVETQDPPAQ